MGMGVGIIAIIALSIWGISQKSPLIFVVLFGVIGWCGGKYGLFLGTVFLSFLLAFYFTNRRDKFSDGQLYFIDRGSHKILQWIKAVMVFIYFFTLPLLIALVVGQFILVQTSTPYEKLFDTAMRNCLNISDFIGTILILNAILYWIWRLYYKIYDLIRKHRQP